MKTTLKVSKVFEVERMIAQFGHTVSAAKLSYGLARNAVRAEEVTKAIKEQLKGGKEIQAFRNMRARILQSGKPQDETNKEIEALFTDEIKAELDALMAKEQELLDMDTEVDWYEIPIAHVPGMDDDAKNNVGVLPVHVFKLLLETGIVSEKTRRLEAVN